MDSSKLTPQEAIGCFWAIVASGVISFAAWLTHVIVCIDQERWGFLIAGALVFPVAVIHGIGIWFGVWH